MGLKSGLTKILGVQIDPKRILLRNHYYRLQLNKVHNGDIMMKKILLAATFLIFTTPAFAGSCPMKVGMIDKALAAGTAKNAEKVKELRDLGETLHKSGKHGQSVQMLVKAMKLAGIS